jgi:aconitase A
MLSFPRLSQVSLDGQQSTAIQAQDIAIALVKALKDEDLGVAAAAESALKQAGATAAG